MRFIRSHVRVLPLFVVSFGLALATPALAEEPWAEEIAAFDAFVEAQMAATALPGLAVGVRLGDWVWTKGYGYSDLENRTPTRPESAYRLASVTKPMTAVGILELYEQGKLDLDADVRTYVPYFPDKGEIITVRQLLGHLGGISHYVDYDVEGHFKDHKTTEESIAVFADFDLVGAPGERYSYTSYGYNLLGAALEGASGMSYGDFMREHVWEPMGMETIRMDDPVAIIPNRVRGYRRLDGEIANSEFVDISSRFAAGGTRATVLDMVRFTQGLEAGSVLEPETTRLMLTSMASADGRFTDYGMGWGVYPLNGRPRYTHSGGQAETTTRLTWMPTETLTFALASNLERADLQPYQEKLAQLFLGETWNRLAFVPGERERAVYQAMAAAFGAGLAAYLTDGPPTTEREIPAERKIVDAAFESFREATGDKAWKRDPDAAKRWLRNGRHPAFDQALVTMGRQMAATLAEDGDTDLDAFHDGGELMFFRAYIDHYRIRKGVPRARRFSKDFERQVKDWAADWQAVWTDELRQLQFVEATELAEIEAVLRRSFEGAAIVPDYTSDLVGMSEEAFLRGDQSAGFAASKLAIDLYPESEAANGLWGVVMVLSGNADAGREHLTKAAALDARGYAGAENLSGIANFLAGGGNTPAAQALLEIASDLHPNDEEITAALASLQN